MWTNLVSLLFLDICILIIILIYFNFGFTNFEPINRWDENGSDDPKDTCLVSQMHRERIKLTAVLER